MQDIHSIGNRGGPRLFGGAGDADRRFRQHHQHHHAPQALKCPRCDSSNTKFCYYNNYNLSQPRHFCKSCRRYWTKGGVLRNVPVGGGCRKTKRSKPKNRNSSLEGSDSRKTANSNSSSDSSSLTANTSAPPPAPAPVPTPASASAPAPAPTNTTKNITNSTLINFQKPDTQFLSPDPNFNPENTLFSDIGTFTSLITSSTTQLPFSPFKVHHESGEKSDWTHGDVLKGSETSSLGFMDGQNWNNGTDQVGLFDLTGSVDHHESYWSTTQWDDHAHDENDQHELDYLR